MAVKFQYRSDSATQAYYAKALRVMSRIQSAGGFTLTAGPAGTFGGTYLDMTGAPIPQWVGFDNAPVGGTALTILLRLVPVGNGAPAALKGIFALDSTRSTNNGQFQGLGISVDTGGRIQLVGGGKATGTNYFNDVDFPTAPTWVANQPTDIWIVWNGTNAANAVQLWQAQNGEVPTQISSLTAGANAEAMVLGVIDALVGWHPADNATNNAFHINEIVVWDSVEDPASYGARAGFIPTSAQPFEGYSQTDPGVANVKTGTNYVYQGTTKTGTYTGADRWSDPGVANVVAGVEYKADSLVNNRTGSYTPPESTDPGEANVLDGVPYEINDVPKVGTYTPGTFTDPGEANVKVGTEYVFDDEPKTGTYTGADRWSDPGEANVTNGVEYLANAVEKTGTRQVVTNILTGQYLTGQSLEATLEGRCE